MPSTLPALVIFDCDGVLVDTERLAVPIEAETITALGWPVTPEEVIERFLGKSEADSQREIEEHLGHPIPPAVSLEIERRHREVFERELRAVEGVVDVLDALDSAGVATCVASGGSHEKMRFTLGLTDLYRRFEGRIFSAGDVALGKPAPDIFLHAKQLTAPEARPGDCAVIEDSPFGLVAALAAGMRAYAYAGGLTPLERLQVPGSVVFGQMADLPALLGL